MKPERWQQITDLYHAAIARAPAARVPFLAEACGGDADLRRRVESLVEAHEEAGNFIKTPAFEAAPELLVAERAGTLASGARLGPYEIVALVGMGGMGEVYRARDTRLDRSVAVKVLPSHLADDPERRQRFEREARAVSSLNHPHICALYDVGRQDGIDYLVMEYVEGETLADRLQRRPLPLEQVLTYAAQIADALDKAHRQGVTHRDLKPGNVMLTKSGTKLLDFGLAKLKPAQDRPAISMLSTLPTEARPLTSEGMLLGTFQYMAPEQLEGKEADARSDIWALGCVIYEMATGKRPFEGTSQASLIAAILNHEPPPISKIQPFTPPALDRLVQCCLAKDPDERWQNARDLRFELDWLAHGAPAELATGTGRTRSATTAWMVAAVLAAALAALAGIVYRRPAADGAETVLRFSIPPPEGATFGNYIDAGAVALSPDGRRLAFTANPGAGTSRLWVRDLDAVTARELPGTEGAAFPFWSPDGRSLGFFAERQLRKLELKGGSSEVLCDAPYARGGTWSREGVILFSAGSSLQSVPASGGPPTSATALALGETAHLWPQFLPDGRQYVFLVQARRREESGIFVSSLGSREKKRLVTAESNAVYAPPGYLLFVKGTTLFAQLFEPGRTQLGAAAVPVAEGVTPYGGAGPATYAPVSASPTGVLVHGRAAEVETQLTWFDREGRPLGSVGPPGGYADPALSRDGTRLAVCREDPRNASPDIWIADVSRSTMTRFTFDPRWDVYPVWSPDAGHIAFSSDRDGQNLIFRKATAGGAEEEQLLKSEVAAWPDDWTPDGRSLIYEAEYPKTNLDLWLLPLDGDRQPKPLLQSVFNEAHARLSPDGRLMAYASDESGRSEIYVRPFPSLDRKWPASTEGGDQPSWRGDGGELFYLAPDGKLMSAATRLTPSFEAGAPRPLFQTRTPPSNINWFRSLYDAAPDGKRFIVVTQTEKVRTSPLTVVLNWPAQLKP